VDDEDAPAACVARSNRAFSSRDCASAG
jgi:hypothetical protein